MRLLSRLALVIGCALIPQPATAQFSLTPMVGFWQYDGANDDGYLAWSLQGRYQIGSYFRVGLQGTTAHIGIVPFRQWTTPTSDQRLWRANVFAEGALPLGSRVELTGRVQFGVFHSSGVTLVPRPPGDDPFFSSTDSDTPTGIAYGAGLGLEVIASRKLRFVVNGDVWQDRAYGGAGFDPDLLFGVSFAL